MIFRISRAAGREVRRFRTHCKRRHGVSSREQSGCGSEHQGQALHRHIPRSIWARFQGRGSRSRTTGLGIVHAEKPAVRSVIASRFGDGRDLGRAQAVRARNEIGHAKIPQECPSGGTWLLICRNGRQVTGLLPDNCSRRLAREQGAGDPGYFVHARDIAPPARRPDADYPSGRLWAAEWQ